MSSVFESPWLLLTLAGVALVVVSIVREDKPEWGYWPLLIPLAIAALAFGLDAAVKTDLESINYIISSSKKSAVNGSAAGFMAFVSPNYADREHPNKAELKTAAERILSKASIEKIKTQSHRIDLKPNTAKSELNIVVHLNKDSQYAVAGSLVFVGMEFEYEKIGEKWMVKSTEVTSINNHPSGWGHIP